jgi:glycosyltransferase involved in cell wall biosynthesis
MPGTTLNSTIHTGITLGTGQFKSPYTIGAHGAIVPTDGATYGLYANASLPVASVVNLGIVTAGASGTAIEFATDAELLNAATIAGANTYPGTGVYLAAGGTVTNTKSGIITAYRIGVHAVNAAATIDNAGTIAGQIIGVRVSGGGLVSNAAGGIITGEYAVQGHINAATVVNSGTIIGQYAGVGLDGGQIVNLAGGAISEVSGSLPGLADKVAAYIYNGLGTITNYGSIGGYYGAAVQGGGLITNALGGTITGAASGLGKAAYITGGPGTVVNRGLLEAYYGAVLENGGAITNAVGATIAGATAIQVFGGAGYVTNAGLLSGDIGVLLGDYGTVTNETTGTIAGGVILEGGTLFNSGAIDAAGDAVSGEDPATVFNNAGATITAGGVGVFLFAGGSVVNAGAITGTSEGVAVRGDAVVVNQAGGVVAATNPRASAVFFQTAPGSVVNAGTIGGIDLAYAGTVENAGVIIGAGGTAVNFASTYAARLIVDPGAVFQGKVQGGSGTNTLELASGGAGTLSGFAAEFAGFGAIVVDSGGNWELDGASPLSGQAVTLTGSDRLALGSPGGFADAIYGFDGSDKLDLLGLAYVSGATAMLNGDTLTVTSGTTTDTFTLPDIETGTKFTAMDDGTPSHGALVEEVTCYCRGTLILTDNGEVPVESLNIGDRLVTRSGAVRPIKWIGRRSYAGWLAAGNPQVWPIVFQPNAITDGVPKRTLMVSPGHAMFLDDALFPAGLLANGMSITKSGALEEVHYFHLELDTHDVIAAEGAWAETFVDDDSRGVFHNAAEFHALYPHTPRGAAAFCAPRIEDGFALDAVRQRLNSRARLLCAGDTPSALDGCVDCVRHDVIKGWAADAVTPGQPVLLAVFDNGVEIGQVVAGDYRRDLELNGIGDGRHSFTFTIPNGLTPAGRHHIDVRGLDGTALPARCATILEPPPPAAHALVPLGALRGNIDSADRSLLAGWAQDDADGERPVCLVVTMNGQSLGRVLANAHRNDLATAGFGSGRHGFRFAMPTGLPLDEPVELIIRRESDGAALPGSPIVLPPIDAADEADALARLLRETEALLARRAARNGGHAEREALNRHRRRWGPRTAEPLPGVGPSVLVIDLRAPDPSRDGASLAILSHMRALVGLGYAVSFAAADGRGDTAARAALSREGIAFRGAPDYAGVEHVLRLHAGTFDLITLHRHETADRYLALARLHHPKARIIYAAGELDHVRLARQAHIERRPELLAYSRRVAAIEAHAAARSDLVLTHSPVEADVLRQAAGFGRVHVAPFAVGANRGDRAFADRRGLAFIGAFDSAANADAVYHLARDIMPRVWACDPSIICRIVGQGWTAARLPGLDPRIEIAGRADDLDGVLGSVRLTVAPLRFGAGLKTKVLMSFAAGVPCVMTAIAAEGLPLVGPLSALVAGDPAAFAERIVQLHTDNRLNDQAAKAAARLSATAFQQSNVIQALREILWPSTLSGRGAGAGYGQLNKKS